MSIEGYLQILRIVDSSAARQRNLILIQEGEGRTRVRSLSKYHATITEICALKHIVSCGTAMFGALLRFGTTL